MAIKNSLRGVIVGVKGGLAAATFFSAVALVIAALLGDGELQKSFRVGIGTIVAWYFVLGLLLGSLVGALLPFVTSKDRAVALSCATLSVAYATTLVSFFPRSAWVGGSLGSIIAVWVTGPMVGRMLYCRSRTADDCDDSDLDPE